MVGAIARASLPFKGGERQNNTQLQMERLGMSESISCIISCLNFNVCIKRGTLGILRLVGTRHRQCIHLVEVWILVDLNLVHANGIWHQAKDSANFILQHTCELCKIVSSTEAGVLLRLAVFHQRQVL